VDIEVAIFGRFRTRKLELVDSRMRIRLSNEPKSKRTVAPYCSNIPRLNISGVGDATER
jgi:hypothetical protein